MMVDFIFDIGGILGCAGAIYTIWMQWKLRKNRIKKDNTETAIAEVSLIAKINDEVYKRVKEVQLFQRQEIDFYKEKLRVEQDICADRIESLERQVETSCKRIAELEKRIEELQQHK